MNKGFYTLITLFNFVIIFIPSFSRKHKYLLHFANIQKKEIELTISYSFIFTTLKLLTRHDIGLSILPSTIR